MTTAQADIPEAFAGLLQPFRYKCFHEGRGSAKSWTFATCLILLPSGHCASCVRARACPRSVKACINYCQIAFMHSVWSTSLSSAQSRSREKRTERVARFGAVLKATMAANSESSATKRRRRPGRPFPQGVSGNPIGRPRARCASPRSRTRLKRSRRSAERSPTRNYASALPRVLDRGWGKPGAPLELRDENRITGIIITIERGERPAQEPREAPRSSTRSSVPVCSGND
jgi:hypothetical protein